MHSKQYEAIGETVKDLNEEAEKINLPQCDEPNCENLASPNEAEYPEFCAEHQGEEHDEVADLEAQEQIIGEAITDREREDND